MRIALAAVTSFAKKKLLTRLGKIGNRIGLDFIVG
jgi:hypothetical protein